MAIDINIPSQVKNYANLAAFPATGSLKTIFIAEDTNKTYRWTGSAYVEISASQATAWGAITGTLSSQTDLNTALSGKVPTSRTLTINGTTQDLSADRTFTISTGITIGTTAITSGTVGRVLFEGTGNVVQESANLFWDNTNGRLGIGTSSPTQALNVSGFSVLTTSKTTATPILAVTNTTSSSPNSNNFDCFAPNMPNASVLGVFYGGKNLSSRNNFGFNWNHVSDGSTGNSVSFEMVSVANIIRAWATGNVGLNTGTDAGFKLDVNGTSVFRGTLGLISTTAIQLAVTTNGNTRILSNNNDIILNAGSSTIEHSFGTYSIRKRMLTTYGDANANAGVAIGVDAINVASAILSAESTTKGFLPPRMTTTQKNAIASPATGLLVYDTTLNLISVYNGTTWITL
jgi:hypothetical protein